MLQEDIKNPRALARKADELWQNSNFAALNKLSYALKMFLHFSPILLPMLLSVLQSLADSPIHPLLDLVLQVGAGITGIMDKKLIIAKVLVLMFQETSWPAGEASSFSYNQEILSHLLPGFSLWKKFLVDLGAYI